MRRRGRWAKRLLFGLLGGALVYLVATAWRDGWGEADPVASVMGGAGALIALLVTLVLMPAGSTPHLVIPAAVSVPDGWVGRDEAAQVVAAVRARTRSRWRGGGAVGITTGLHGAGGFGKTTLARYVAAQGTVRRRFPGGVWVITIGRDVRGRDAVAAKVAAETRRITGDTAEAGDDPDQAGARLEALLEQRPRTLLVIDDVWEKEQLRPFLLGAGPKCVLLVTTRNPEVLPDHAARIVVDRMSGEQAREVLTRGLPRMPEEGVIEELIETTGRWVLLLRIANRVLGDRIATGADPTGVARHLLEHLRPAALPRTTPTESSIWTTSRGAVRRCAPVSRQPPPCSKPVATRGSTNWASSPRTRRSPSNSSPGCGRGPRAWRNRLPGPCARRWLTCP